eukprot:2081659-Amphidinium_carterae.1
MFVLGNTTLHCTMALAASVSMLAFSLQPFGVKAPQGLPTLGVVWGVIPAGKYWDMRDHIQS